MSDDASASIEGTVDDEGTRGEPDETSALLAALVEEGLTLAVAESLTGGALTAELTRPPGASAVVMGGIVVYATELKSSMVGVDAELLRTHGPVHPEVAKQLAAGVRERLVVDGRSADIGVSTTGVAGPESQGGRPPGTVFIGLAMGSSAVAFEHTIEGSRSEIRAATVGRAVRAIADAIAARSFGVGLPLE